MKWPRTSCRSTVDEQGPRRILKPARRKQNGARWIGIVALVERLNLLPVLGILRQRTRDLDRRADVNECEKTRGGLLVQPHAAVRVRIRMYKTPVESVGGGKFP